MATPSIETQNSMAPARFSHCPRCGDVREWRSATDWFECEPACGYRACTHCHPEMLITPGRGLERLLAAVYEPGDCTCSPQAEEPCEWQACIIVDKPVTA